MPSSAKLPPSIARPSWRSSTPSSRLRVAWSGFATLTLSAHAEVALMAKGCSAPNSRVYTYVVEQPLTVR